MTTFRLGCLTVLLAGLVSAQAEPNASDLDILHQLNRSFIEIANKVSASVVVVNVVQKESPGFADGEEQDGPDSMPPGFWKKFHEQFRRTPMEKSVGQGSGIIIRENGYILTNGHVVEDAESISVRLQDGRKFKATLRGTDPQSDIAVIKIDAQGLAVATLADSDQTRIGEFAIAIGSPFGFDFSVTIGHVSAKSRSVIDGLEGMSMDQDFIQTDALINPGNSGGPLVNIDGQVIGINTLIQGFHTGIGFAVPSSLAKEVSDQIIESGKFTRPYLGISMRAIRDDPDLRELIPGVQDGVVVGRIIPNSPAAKSKLKPSDIITSVDGQAVTTPQQLRGSIRHKKIGSEIVLNVFRQGSLIPITVNPGEWPEAPSTVAKVEKAPTSKGVTVEIGITVKPLTPALAAQLGTDAREGVLVATVEKNSPAGRIGIKPGDIITSNDQQPIDSRKQFQSALEKIDLKKGAIVNLISGNTARFVIVKANP
jgi:Do/DeqQ family serine protease